MSADIDIVNIVDGKFSGRSFIHLPRGDWADLRAEIVRLRGEAAPAYDRELVASMLTALWESQSRGSTKSGYRADTILAQIKLLRDADSDDAAGVRAASIAPAEAKGDGLPTFWDIPKPADGGAVASHYGEGAAFGDTARMIRRGFDAPCKICGKLCDEGNGPCAHPPAAQPSYTTGHCENHRRPGGCPMHNLQCGYPECDRKPAQATHPSACELGAARARFEDWMVNVAKIIVGSSDPYPARLEQDYWRVWQAALQHRGDSRGGEGV